MIKLSNEEKVDRIVKLVNCDGLYYRADNVECKIGDYVILDSTLVYLFGEIIAEVFVRESDISKISPLTIGKVVATATHVINEYEAQ